MNLFWCNFSSFIKQINTLPFNEAPFAISLLLFVGNFAEIGVAFCRKRLNWNGKFSQNLLGEALLTSSIAVHDLHQSTAWCFSLSCQGKYVVRHSRYRAWKGPASLLTARLLPLLFVKCAVSAIIYNAKLFILFFLCIFCYTVFLFV